MKLTTEQLDLISKEIIEGGIRYQDLYEELLDHYILAIEDRVDQGKLFEDAFTEVHSGFEKYRYPLSFRYYYDVRRFKTIQVRNYGLVKLQEEYKERLNKEISKRHWHIMKDYFRWPTIVTTLLVGLLTFQFAYLVPREYYYWIMIVCAFTPLLIILPQYLSMLKRYFFNNRRFINSLQSNAILGRAFLTLSFFNVFTYLPRLVGFDSHLLAKSPLASIAAITCFYIAYSLSFYQLYRERFKVTMT